jgi:two-component system sensor histidine kinase UhpB
MAALMSLSLALEAAPATPPTPTVVRLDKALSAVGDSPIAPGDFAALPVALPDRWALNHPDHGGVVWYRTAFKFAESVLPGDMLALYVDQACSNVQVLLNGHLIFSSGRMVEPVSRNCQRPQLISLPPALLNGPVNVVDLRMQGYPLGHVASVRRAGSLSPIELGLQSELAARHTGRLFWEPTWIRGGSLVLIGLGCLMLAIGWLHKREVYFAYFGWLCLGCAGMSAASWALDLPWPNAVTEFLLCSGWAVLLACAVQFLLSFAGLRSRAIENVLAVQWVLVPLSLVVAGGSHLFVVANVWYVLLTLELAGAVGIYLLTMRTRRRGDFLAVLLVAAIGLAALLGELATQWGWIEPRPVSVAEWLLPLLLVYVGGRLFLMFAKAMRETVADRNRLAEELRRMGEEMAGRVELLTAQRVEQLTARRVEQFTVLERRRIASDLHDDLGAKLLTIVHASDGARVPQLAREALDEMRLSVRGLAGKPVALETALADWRAEIMARLEQADIKAFWSRPEEELPQTLSSRVFMQVTRILREAVSNVIRHSGASACEVRCRVSPTTLRIIVRDDGRGITVDLRQGLGMTTMKRRAKKIEGQCLVESKPGAGVVISLTVPL